MAKKSTFTHLAVFDDGTGFSKGWIRDLTTGEERSERILAVVSDYAELPEQLDQIDRIPPVVVELPGKPIPYLFGEDAMTTGDGSFEMTRGRYISQSARIRFYGMLGKLLGNTSEAVLHLTVGANSEIVGTYQEAIQLFFENRDTKNNVQPHVFMVDGREYRVSVPRCLVLDQAIAAAKGVRVCPPASLVDAFERIPFDRATSIIVDGGRLSTDIAVLEPHPTLDNVIRVRKTLGIAKGVGVIADQLAVEITKRTGMQPPLRLLEAILDPRTKTYGKVWSPYDRDTVNLLPLLEQIREHVWASVFTDIRRALKGTSFRYFVVVGGFPLVAESEIRTSVFEEIIDRRTKQPMRLGDLSGFAIPEDPHLIVLYGMIAAGEQDAAK